MSSGRSRKSAGERHPEDSERSTARCRDFAGRPLCGSRRFDGYCPAEALHFRDDRSEAHPEGLGFTSSPSRRDAERCLRSQWAASITTHKGAIEDWTIQSLTQEMHEFHIHQIHFQVVAIERQPVPPQSGSGTTRIRSAIGTAYPNAIQSVTLRMDFRGNIDGEIRLPMRDSGPRGWRHGGENSRVANDAAQRRQLIPSSGVGGRSREKRERRSRCIPRVKALSPPQCDLPRHWRSSAAACDRGAAQ